MKIGFLGNANNGPFMVARQIKALGHEVIFIVDSSNVLNRPEGRYTDVPYPYPEWIIDLSPLDIWSFPHPHGDCDRAVSILRSCDAVVLNEFSPALWGKIQKPAFMLLTGTDIEILADCNYVDHVSPRLQFELLDAVFNPKAWIDRLRSIWVRRHYSRLVMAQRDAIKNAVGVHYFPKGMLPNADRLFNEIGVDNERRVFSLPSEIGRYPYLPYPKNDTLRLFNVARLQWKTKTWSELDNKGSDVLIRGVGLFLRSRSIPVEVRLVNKGVDTCATRRLIREEGIEPFVKWLEPMDQNALMEEYSKADIVFDHFGNGSIGMGAIDAMAVGRPVIANATPHIFNAIFGEELPICHATTPTEVSDQLTRLASDHDLRESIGVQSRRFVEQYCDPKLSAISVLSKLDSSKVNHVSS